MRNAYIVDGVRTPIGSFAGALSGMRPDDLAALTIRALLEKVVRVESEKIVDVIFGCETDIVPR